ncbi:leukocyte immunoglobulin-like receptor subfamily B member 2 isoform X2 [Manis pentadactyla]|uniref:leukocyte immunoglobulin-like receptor subfamily B member 2 isoform X2 n=1 Tax=Manis pentadactyla TaxID=143292 RepID=UPI00255C90FD|nr:leukocyte immunoglobulin-like receptor subfamily B member 2 isoform X2 [Manis pentadactyla]
MAPWPPTVHLLPSSGPTADDQEETLYEVVKDTQPEDDRQLESQARASEEPQVTDAELNHLTLGQETRAPPPSQAGQPPAEPGVYAALATH